MATEPLPTTALAAEVAAQRAELAALRARLDRPTRSPRRRGLQRIRALAVAGLLTALLPLGIMAATPTFSDLNTAAPEHRPNIQTIANAGITTGFDDPNSADPNVRVYYPKDNVTREEMATFLSRLGGLNGNPPIVNAATAQTVANGGVTATSISPAGSTNGQVLTSTGNGVSWQNATGGGAPGPVGPAGPTGPTGPTGPIGPTGPPGAGAGNAQAYTSCGPANVSNEPPCTVNGPNTIAIPIIVINTPQATNGYLDFTAPSDGYVYVTTSVTVSSAAAATVQLFLVRGTLSTDTPRSTVAAQTLPANIAALTKITHTWVFPVQAGVVAIRAFVQSDTLGTIRVGEESSSALFIPATLAP